jgi:hypothetical protein
MKLAEIRDTSISPIIANYQLCGHCKKVDQDMGRLCVSYKCPVCDMPGDTGHGFFDMDIQILIDLIQEAYHLRPRKKLSIPVHAHSLSVLVLFCTLREVLLERLIAHLMEMHGLPDSIRERLWHDNRNYSDRMDGLFPSLIGTKSWKASIHQLQNKTQKDYIDINDFLKKASDMRNDILHEGVTWPFEADFIKDCLERIPLLLNLYVDFHNTFIHPVYFERLCAERMTDQLAVKEKNKGVTKQDTL